MQSTAKAIQLTDDLIVEEDLIEESSENDLSSPEFFGAPGYLDLRSVDSVPEANESKGKTRVEESLTKLNRLIANVTESYTSAIFVADVKNKVLHSLAHHSLSRDYIEGVTIPYGRGLVGWVAENRVRIAVCPFEHDARTLLYYPVDQSLKSFIAVPILSAAKELVGVIVCDSKKSYAFPKITEKILTECAAQANLLINLHQSNEALLRKAPEPKKADGLEKVIDAIRASNSEEELFQVVCTLPQELVSRDAFIALVTSHDGYGEPTFYSHSPESRFEHHLVDLVCKSKKIICSERSVHVLPSDDIRARSFLSVPFHVFGQEAGALNVLSAALRPFSTNDIEALEKIAAVIGRELARLRSAAVARVRQVGPSMLPWSHFSSQVEKRLASGAQNCSLVRIQLFDLPEIEKRIGVEVCAEVHEQLLRFIQQLAPVPALVSAPYGTSIFLFGDKVMLESVVQRVRNILSRIHSVSGSMYKMVGTASSVLGNLDSRASAFISESLLIHFSSVGPKDRQIGQLISRLSSGEASSRELVGSGVISGGAGFISGFLQRKQSDFSEPVLENSSSENDAISLTDVVSDLDNSDKNKKLDSPDKPKVFEPVENIRAENLSASEWKINSSINISKNYLESESSHIGSSQIGSSQIEKSALGSFERSSSQKVCGSERQNPGIRREEKKSLEEFILGDAASSRFSRSDTFQKRSSSAQRGKNNARFW
ncbi:MAG TPA: GAF domain-containing protein [Oligoflexia bacterium]|mgnify:CR=1 FL=1|nr:GAF domain-containing protein [Oligoflexia bacterium]HMP49773.1 GAF domain-containing protein [Oligoflexia bacterium]